MTGVQLYQWLRKSGSGVNKLAYAKALLRAKPDAAAADVIGELEAAPDRLPPKDDGTSDVIAALNLREKLKGTIAKAKEIIRLGRWSPELFAEAEEPMDDFDRLLEGEPEPAAPREPDLGPKLVRDRQEKKTKAGDAPKPAADASK